MLAFVASLWLGFVSFSVCTATSKSLKACAGSQRSRIGDPSALSVWPLAVVPWTTGAEATCNLPTLASESLLLQAASSAFHGGVLPSEEGRGGSLEVDAPSEQVDVWEAPTGEGQASCAAPCLFNGGNYSCRARVSWVLEQQANQDLDVTVNLVNVECMGQCSCNVSHFISLGHGTGTDEGPCHTAQVGERCYQAVEWARTNGMRLHPERYTSAGLTAGSTFEEFQYWMYRRRLEHCSRPCDLCHTAVPGEECYDEVMAELDGEAAGATFIDLQSMLAMRAGNTTCPVPCGRCHTAMPGEQCYEGALWAKMHGIRLTPETYPGLSAESPIEDFQEVLHRMNLERCTLPCRHRVPPPSPAPTAAPTSDSTKQVTSPVSTTAASQTSRPPRPSTTKMEAPVSTSASVPSVSPVTTTVMSPPVVVPAPPGPSSTTMMTVPPVPVSSTIMPVPPAPVTTMVPPPPASASTTMKPASTVPVSTTMMTVQPPAITTLPDTTTLAGATQPTPPGRFARGSKDFADMNVMLDMELDFIKEVVTIRLAGPEGVWFGVGFEALTMADRPYVIIVDGKTGAFQERKLGKYGAGEPLVTTLEEVSPPAHINGLCYVELRRPLASASLKHTSFEPPISVMNIIAAVGEFRQFGQHGPHRAAWVLRFVRDVQLPTSWVPTTMAPVGGENATTVTTTTSSPRTASTSRLPMPP